MVKMAYAPLPKLIPINASNMCPNNMTKVSLCEVLQSDPVKRLFNQPNIIIKTIPLNSVAELDKNIFDNKRNGMNAMTLKPPAISIVPVRIPDEEKEDANLLPSKIEDKKSEIALLPVKKKLCGHYEPCENIICDVIVQQYVDDDRVSPMLAVNIEEEEINAPVGKHCKNEYCDALSIDHNRCRRASIKLHRCDKSRACDICGITLEGRKSRIYHRNCTRKDEYRHNNIDRVHLLKERMRERELQILEITKMKRNDYSDPAKAMEILRKNEEIIIIPKTTPSQQPIITITSIPTTQSIGTNASNAQPIKINSQGNNFANILGSVPLTISPQNTSCPIESKTQSINQVGFSNLQQSYVTSTSTPISVPVSSVPVATSVPASSSQNQYVHMATCLSQTTNIQSLSINNWVVSPSHILTTPIQAKPFSMPIRVVPITNLITAPSLLHRTQGIPKFCIMAENVTPVTIPNPSSLQPAAIVTANAVNTSTTTSVTSNTITTTQQKDTSKVPIQHYSIQKLQGEKILKRKKTFFCDYCSKHFSTDWYFKMHIAKHKGVKLFFCNLCDESFSNKYDMKKHMTKQHSSQKDMFTTHQSKEFSCNKCDYVCKSLIFFKNHIKTHATLNSDKVNIKVRKQKLKSSEEKVNHTTSVHDSNRKDMKELSLDEKDISSNLKNKVSVETTQDNVKNFQNIVVKNDDDIDLKTINENDSAKLNGFTFVSIEKSLHPKNSKPESIITS
ncbi:uncharacterized protein LOC126850677 [Cataglyphis hispanica]|uniref:uncharacterized protein LOC126850677 n=1 Tax=Cataglyphis hispanica TaxID=1086592 RepID=UPI00217F3D91|nr:uncharacterized protein LOC126850677 [Cataglyphis hispanica]